MHALGYLAREPKFCVEIDIVAADTGRVLGGREVIAIEGAGIGADTAPVMKPATTSRFFNLEIKEIITKPRNI